MTTDSQSAAPPRWAEAWLRWQLPLRDRETVSGDLLEEYRENIRPRRSRWAADLWYVRQVSVFGWRVAVWALASAAILIGRTALDWYVPAADLTSRAEATTLATATVLLVMGASTTLRTRSIAAGVNTTASALVLSAILCTLAYVLMYARWHDPVTVAVIERSGGLAEVFLLPVILIGPGVAVGALGAWLASIRHRWKAAID